MKITEIEAGEKEPIPAGSSFEPAFIEHIVPLLKKDCRQSIKTILGVQKFLYRGLHGRHPDAFIGRSRENRRPSSSPAFFQDNIDAAFSMAGFSANRSNSIYATSDIQDASIYAVPAKNLCYIFPKDGFNFTWSPEINDLFAVSSNIFTDDDGYSLNGEFQYNDQRTNIPLLELFLKRTRYTNKFLSAAILSENEIMISGEYYAINKYTIKEEVLLNALA